MDSEVMLNEKLCERYGEILKTENYDLFHKLKGNRKIDEAHVLRLMESFSNIQLIVPIIINENFQIIDGQHRYEACRRLGKPVYYVVISGYGIEECHILNANTKNYKPEDFLKGYADLGYEEYVKFNEFSKLYPFLSMHLCQIYLTGGVRKEKDLALFKTGNFKITNWDKACMWAERTYMFEPYAKGFLANRNFNTAILKFYQHPQYDHKKMINKISLNSAELRIQAKERYFVEMLCNIYNVRSKDAKKGHAKWVNMVKNDTLPNALTDIQNDEFADMLLGKRIRKTCSPLNKKRGQVPPSP